MKLIFITTLYPDSKEQSLTKVPYTLHYFVKHWVAEGHEVEVVKVEAIYPKFLPQYIKENQKRKERNVVIDGIEIHVVQVRKKLNRKFSQTFASKVGQKVSGYLMQNNVDYDAVIFHIFDPCAFIANAVKKQFNIPAIWGFHQTDLNWVNNGKNVKILNRTIGNIAAIAFRSKSLERSFSKRTDTKLKTFQIPSGVPEDTINVVSADNSNTLTRFVTVANMIKRKNIDVVIKAFARIHATNRTTILNVIGDGAEIESLKNLVKKLELEESVLFLGHRERKEVFSELKNSDIFVLPSVNETFGIVYLEAMSQGCIPIGTKGEGIDGIIADKLNGFLCNPNEESCYRKMQEAIGLSNSEVESIYKQLSKVVYEYTEKQCANNYATHIEEVIKGF